MALEHIALIRDLDVPPPQKLLLFALASRADHAGRCWPSVQRVCRDTGLSRRAVQIHLGHLEACGALVRDGRSGRSSVYRLTLDRARTASNEGSRKPEVENTEQRDTHMRMSCAAPAHAVRTPAQVMHRRGAHHAPEVKTELSIKSQEKPVDAAAPVDKRPVQRTTPWWRSRQAVLQMGVDLGLPPRPGETYSVYKDRVYKASRPPRE